MTEYVMPALTDYPDWFWSVEYTGNEVIVSLYNERGGLEQQQSRHHHSEYPGSAAEVAVEVGLGILLRVEAVEKALQGLVLNADDTKIGGNGSFPAWVNNQVADYLDDKDPSVLMGLVNRGDL